MSTDHQELLRKIKLMAQTEPNSLKSTVRLIEQIHPREVDQYRRDRPFRLPKQYPKWETLSAIAVASTLIPLNQYADQNSRTNQALWKQWKNDHGPLYCLSRELLRLFQATDASNLAGLIPDDWVPPLPVLVIALPDGEMATPDGSGVSYLLVGLEHPTMPFKHIRFAGLPAARMCTSTTDAADTTWGNTSLLGATGLINDHTQFGRSATNQAEQEWLASISAIALQCVMALSYLPELVSGPELPSKAQAASPIRKSQADKFLSPRWIGKDFVRPRSTGVGFTHHHDHRSPATHLRRGHWRQQPVGPQRQSRVPTWIRPTIINAEPPKT
jgi:hypothetical protein